MKALRFRAKQHLFVVHIFCLQNVERHRAAPEAEAEKRRDVSGGLAHPVVIPDSCTTSDNLITLKGRDIPKEA